MVKYPNHTVPRPTPRGRLPVLSAHLFSLTDNAILESAKEEEWP